jgi:type II pantothenate kinase
MVRAGVDCGTTLKKLVWSDDDGLHYAIHWTDESLAETIQQKGITTVARTGIRSLGALPERVRVVEFPGDKIEVELKLQIAGARALLKATHGDVSNFLLVSIGTGVSYSRVAPNAFERYPIGSAIGGGLIKGIAALCGVTLAEIAVLVPSCDIAADIFIKDIDLEKNDTLEGNMVLSHFGNVTRQTPKAHVVASAINTVAACTVKDVWNLLTNGFAKDIEQVVYIGTPIAKIPALCDRLVHYHTLLPVPPLMLSRGEFAGALGALMNLNYMMNMNGVPNVAK